MALQFTNFTVVVGYSYSTFLFEVNNSIHGGSGDYTLAITQPSQGTITKDPNVWGRYTYTKAVNWTVGAYPVTLTVTDNVTSEQVAGTITISTAEPTQQMFYIQGDSVLTPVVGEPFSVSYSTTSSYTTPLSWSISSGTLPAGLTLTTNTLSGTATALGTTFVTLQAQDGSDPVKTATLPLTIVVGTPLTINSYQVPETLLRGKDYSFTFTASGGSATKIWSVSNAPRNMYMSTDGRLFGAPNLVGDYATTVTVSSGGITDSTTLEWSVADAGSLVASPDIIATGYNTPVTIDVMANDTGANISIIGLSTPGHGTAVVSAGTIVYTPAVGFSGDDTFVYTLSDGSTTAQGTVTVTVGAPGVVDAPLITNAPSGDIAVQQGDAYSLTLTATGGVPPYRWGISSSSSAINWLTVNPTTGALAGTFNNPSATPGYTDTFLVTVTDTAIPPKTDTATLSFVLGVSPYTATIQGTLRLDTSTGAFAARKVYLYNYTTGAKVAETTSNGTTGAWEFTAVAPGEYFVVGVAQGDDLNIPRDFDAMGVITVA